MTDQSADAGPSDQQSAGEPARPSTEAEVTLRDIRRRLLALAWLATGVLFALQHQWAGSGALMFPAGLWLVLGGLYFVSGRRLAIVLTGDGLIIRRQLSSLALSWPQIRAIEVVDKSISRYVVVHTRDGSRHRLATPTDNLGLTAGRFFDRVRLIEQYWIDHRGPSGQLSPSNPDRG